LVYIADRNKPRSILSQITCLPDCNFALCFANVDRYRILYLMIDFNYPFYPGYPSFENYPLQRYLPPIPDGMLKTWLRKNVPREEWIIDPFGTSPIFAIEAAQAGYRVMVICNNPILQFMLEVLAGAFKRKDFLSALADLAFEKRDNERLETHLRAIYQTQCLSCKQTIDAQAFLWKRGENTPFARTYKCPHCKDEGERPVNSEDLDRLSSLGSDALHRSRALQRVSLGAGNSEDVKEALETYLGRPLYFIFSLINRIDRMQTSDQNKQLLRALLLNVMDEGNTLWSWPSVRNRPKQLSTPPVFRENNLWTALVDAIPQWTLFSDPVQITQWPTLPAHEGSICLYKGRLKSLIGERSNPSFQAGVMIFPRPNQAFWTLSAIWSGWFWGRKAVIPLKSALDRRRYDWNWYTTALHTSLSQLNRILSPHTKIFGILSELESGFLTATILAAESAGYHLRGISLREEQDIAQGLWLPDDHREDGKVSLQEICVKKVSDFFNQFNQPASKLQILTCCLGAITSAQLIPISKLSLPYYSLRNFQNNLPDFTSKDAQLKRYELENHLSFSQRELWWMPNAQPVTDFTLSDRIELELIWILNNYPGITFYDLDKKLCEFFPGLYTPSSEFVRICLESYAEPGLEDPLQWYFKQKETAAERQNALATVNHNIKSLGERLGFRVLGEKPIVWEEQTGTCLYRFYTITSSIASHYLLNDRQPLSEEKVIVLPGSRARLLSAKIMSDPRVHEIIQKKKWRFIKFRHFQHFMELQEITPTLWEQSLDRDPPQFEEPTQMQIF